MATSFGNNGHYQVISQKHKKAGTCGAKSKICIGYNFHYINISLNNPFVFQVAIQTFEDQDL